MSAICYVCGNDVPVDSGWTQVLSEERVMVVCNSCIGRKAAPDLIHSTTSRPSTVLEEAARLTSTDRHTDYGPYADEAANVAAGWNVLITAYEGQGVSVIDPRLVPLMMIWLKLVRQAHRHKRDNLVDVAGYAHLAQTLATKETPT